MPDPATQIAQNVARVRRQIAEAAGRAGRDAERIMLVAVTKYVGEAEIRELVRAGCNVLGENRPQHLFANAQSVDDQPIRWHMIGHLQRNKVRRTLPLVEMIQSADSRRLIAAVDRIAGELSRRVPVLLEVNVSGDAAKHGFQPAGVVPLLDELPGYRNVEVRGLMCIAGLEGGLDVARRDFARLRELRDRLQTNCPEGVELSELSMGMSRDYEVAVEEGATIVRVGSALYQGVLG